MRIGRILRHLIAPQWVAHRALPRAVLEHVAAEIKSSEALHRGEIRFVAEAALDLWPLLKGVTPRARALEVFSQFRVWDTEENSGILVYVQLIDHHIEIVADRGINAKVEQRHWEAICRRMEEAFRARRFEKGALEGIREITGLLARHFPARGVNPDELPDKPVVL